MNEREKCKNQAKDNDKNSNKILITIIIVLIIIIILLLMLWKFDKNQKKLTGNVDVFEIECNCKDKEPADDSNDVVINDSDITWLTSNQLKIFKNPVYEMSEIIAPGSSNAYHFAIKNNGDCNFIYQLQFQEQNEFNINMKYRLKRNNEYIDKSWVSYDKLFKDEISLKKGQQDDYILEWKWVESINDTEVGSNISSSYNLKIEVAGKQEI